jgi:hypothetical protein
VVNEAATYVCPACGQPVNPGEGEGSPERDERRFHVGHFRGRLGDRFYELVTPAEG